MRLRLALLLALAPMMAAAQTVVTPGNKTYTVKPLDTTSIPLVATVPFDGSGAASTNNIATAQTTVGSSATLVAAARAGRKSIIVTNFGSVDVFCGPSGVTTATGDLIVGVRGAGKVYDGGAAVFCIVASGTQTISVVEAF